MFGFLFMTEFSVKWPEATIMDSIEAFLNSKVSTQPKLIILQLLLVIS